MKSVLATLKALVSSVLTNEPTLVIGFIVSTVVAGLGVFNVVAPVGDISILVTVIVGALVTRSAVTPVTK